MKITATIQPANRTAWRDWLEQNHDNASEIWLVSDQRQPSSSYLETVEEALCYGWIDGIAKRVDAHSTAQRFTPRRQKSHWTELNKERARRLIAQGKMTGAGQRTLPNLEIGAFNIAPDLEAALKSDPQVWQHFQAFPSLYQRIRIGYIEEMRRNRPVFDSRLRHFLKRTRDNQQFGGLE